MAERIQEALEPLGRHCAILLTSAVSKASDETHEQLEDLMSRFKIWAGSIGLFAGGRAGVDHRFGSDDEARNVLYSMLKGLEKALEKVLQPEKVMPEGSQGSRLSNSGNQNYETRSSLDSSSEESSIEEDYGSSTSDIEDITHPPTIKAIEEIINQLYRFLKLVKSPVSSGEYSKVTNFAAKHCDKEEDSAFEHFIRFTLEREMPRMSTELSKRFINAAMYRRWKMLYKQEHARKLRGNVENLLPTAPNGTDDNVDIQGPKPLQFMATNLPAIAVQDSAPAQAKVRFAPMSHTEASTIQGLKVPLPARSLAPSNVTPSGVVRRGKLDIPAAPQPERETLRETVCPYCTQVIRPELYGHSPADKARWARHVIRDCYSYICLFDECTQSLTHQFSTQDEWMRHMVWSHAQKYICKAPGHEDAVYDSEASFKDHLSTYHKEDVSPSGLDDIVKKAVTPCDDIYSALRAQNKLEVAENLCFLCANDMNQTNSASAGPSPVHLHGMPDHVRNHLSGHLEQLALLSLPIADNAESDVVDSRVSINSPKSKARNFEDLLPVRPSNLFENVFEDPEYLQMIEEAQDRANIPMPTMQEVQEARMRYGPNTRHLTDAQLKEMIWQQRKAEHSAEGQAQQQLYEVNQEYAIGPNQAELIYGNQDGAIWSSIVEDIALMKQDSYGRQTDSTLLQFSASKRKRLVEIRMRWRMAVAKVSPPYAPHKADPLGTFRSRYSDDDVPFAEGKPRPRTPYTSSTGEKTYLSSDALKRSVSSREPPGLGSSYVPRSGAGNFEVQLTPRQRWLRGITQVIIILRLQGGKVTKRSDPPHLARVAHSWDQYCRANHPDCLSLPSLRDGITPLLPTRVIRVASLDAENYGESNPVLYTSKPEERDEYVALSYFWGSRTFPIKTDSLAQYESGGFTNLPQIFRDAVTMTSLLGFKYLWIDALCILQDSYSDWQQEAKQADNRHKEATLVIAATSAVSPHDSLFRRHDTHVHYKEHPEFGMEVYRQRAWTFQDILNRRILSFERSEMTWICKRAQRCECTSWTVRKPLSEHSAEDLYSSWRDFVISEYSKRKLGIAIDRLPALSPVAKEYSDELAKRIGKKPTYLAGIWLEDLVASLCWYARAPFDDQEEHKAYVGPSWSWVSVQSQVEYSRRHLDQTRHGPIATWWPKIKSAHCALLSDDPFGQVKAGELGVSGIIIPVIVSTDLDLGDISERIETTVVVHQRDIFFCMQKDRVPPALGSTSSGTCNVYLDRTLPSEDLVGTPHELFPEHHTRLDKVQLLILTEIWTYSENVNVAKCLLIEEVKDAVPSIPGAARYRRIGFIEVISAGFNDVGPLYPFTNIVLV